jgi:hypothetical protein
LAVIAACSLVAASAHAAGVQPQADVAVMRETSEQVAASVTEAVDAALLRALGEVAGISKPTLSPVDYGEVQLTVGCSDESSECLAAITRIAEVDAIVVRDLSVAPDGTLALRILYFDEAGGSTHVQIGAPADQAQRLPQAVPDLVRELFQLPEPAAPSAVAPAAAAPSPVASSPSGPAAATSDRGASISALTWIALGAGVATLGTGVVLGITAGSDYDQWKGTRVRTRAEAEDASQQFSSIGTRGTLANVMIPVGAVLLGAGAVLLGLDLSSEVTPTPSGGTVAVRGRFGGPL